MEQNQNPKQPMQARTIWIIAGILFVLFLALLSWALMTPSGPGAQVNVPVDSTIIDSQQTPEEEEIQYPDLYSVELDDFMMSVDGSFEVRCSYNFESMTKEYLEKYMELNPQLPYTVEKADDTYIVHVEGGKDLTEPLTVKIMPAFEWQGEKFEAKVMPHFAVRLNTEAGIEGAAIDKPVTLEFSKEISEEQMKALIQNGLSFSEYNAGDERTPVTFTITDVQKRTVKLAPDELLHYASRHMITLPETAVSSVDGDAFVNVQTMEFRTEIRAFNLTMQNQRAGTFQKNEPLVFSYFCQQMDEDAPTDKARNVQVELFRFPDAKAYKSYISEPLQGKESSIYDEWGRRKQISQRAPTDALPQIDKMQDVQMKPGETNVTMKNPGEGFYIVKTTVEDDKTKEALISYKTFQVTAFDIYMQNSNGRMLLWLNDGNSEKTAQGYTIRFNSGTKELVSCVTGADGIATLDVPKEMPSRVSSIDIFEVYDPSGSLIYLDNTDTLSYQTSYDVPDKYYSFFYVDRAVYRPTDTISFWGYVKPYRYNQMPMPRTVTVTFDEGGLNESVEVRLDGDGFYQGELKIEKVVSAGYVINVTMPGSRVKQSEYDTYLSSKYVDVNEYHKPLFTIESEIDKLIYQKGDTVDVTVTPKFYDGTPLPDYTLEFSVFNTQSGEFEDIQKITTDSQGIAHAEVTAGAGQRSSEISWKPKHAYYYVKIASDGETITHRGQYAYVPGKIALDPKITFNADKSDATLTVDAYEVNLENIKTEEDLQSLFSYTYGESQNSANKLLFGRKADVQELTVRLNYEYAGEEKHDYNSKSSVKLMQVKNGQGKLEHLLDFPFAKGYYLYIYANLSYTQDGDIIQDEANASNSVARRWYDSGEGQIEEIEGYYLSANINGASSSEQIWEQWYDRINMEAAVGDRVTFTLYKDNKPVQMGDKGRFLYMTMQNRMIDRKIISENHFDILQKQEYANNLQVVGVYFDGVRSYPVKNFILTMDPESLELTVDVTADKESYQPGGSVTLTANVKDKKGNPVVANVCFSVVDESVFALNEQYFDVQGELYGELSFSNDYIWKYTSTTGDINPYANGGDGGKGEGENMAAYDMFRKNFKDTAAFRSVKSGKDGVAKLTFTLPDNVTSWRVTALAISSEKLFGGSVKSNFISTLPFFAQPVLSEKYLAGDEVAMLVQGHGSALKEGDSIAYTVHIVGDGVDQTYTEKGEAYESIQISLGKLKEGDYTVTSTASFGQMRDTVELPLSVIANNLELVVNKELDLQKPVQIDAMRYPVTITFYQQEYEAYYRALSRLLTHYCQRIDQRLSRYTAKRALQKQAGLMPLPRHLQSDFDISVYQNTDGGIGWYEDDEQSDPVLTAKVLFIVKDSFNQKRVEKYLLEALQDYNLSDEDHGAVLAGLYLLNRSKYADQAAQILRDGAQPIEAKLYLTAALAYGGDTAAAKEAYATYVTPYIHKTSNDVFWVDYYSDTDMKSKNDKLTALASLSASKLALYDDTDGFMRYLGQYSWGIPYIFETMAYVENYDRPVKPTDDFTYTANGKTNTVKMDLWSRACIVLNASQMRDLKFHNVPSSLRAIAYYIGEPDEVGLQPSENFTIEKQVKDQGDGKYENKLTIHFDSAAPLGEYDLSDWIPSSMRLYSYGTQTQKWWVRKTQENQKLYFSFNRTATSPDTLEITYYTQRTFDVPAVVDKAYMMHVQTGESAYSERSSI